MTNVMQITQLVQNVALASKYLKPIEKKKKRGRRKESNKSTEEPFRLADNLEFHNYFLHLLKTEKCQVFQRSYCCY